MPFSEKLVDAPSFCAHNYCVRQTRCEPRMPFTTSVRVFGLDSAGRAVNAPADTVDISRRGVRVGGVAGWQQPGETIGLRHGQEKARYQIVWVGRAQTPLQGQLGLMCLEIGKVIWSAELEQSGAGSDSPRGGHTEGAYRRAPRASPAPALSAPKVPNRRRYARFVVEGGAHIEQQGALLSQWATVHDISLGGCYVETTSPFSLDAPVEAALHVGDFQFRAHGLVANVDPMTGMGIKFTGLMPMHRARLEGLIAALSQNVAQA